MAVTSHAAAQCIPTTAPTSGTVVTCSGSSTAPVVAVPGSTGVTINVNPGASVSGNHATAVPFPVLSVEQSSTITNSGTVNLSGGAGSGTNRGAAMLGDINSNNLINGTAATISTTGTFNDGMAANGSGNTLTNNGRITTTGPNAYGMSAAWGQSNAGQLNNTLINSGTVSTSGSSARAASILGGSGTINNSGTLSTTGAGSTGTYLQGNNDQLINSGTINVSGAGSFAVDSNTVSSSFTASIQNTGSIVSTLGTGIRTLNGNTTITNAGTVTGGGGTAISMGNGNDSLVLQTGSIINGTADGGAGTNTVTLQGTGTASNTFANFQTLIMQGTNWNWTGSGTFTTAQVQSGLLNVTGILGASTAANVSPGATLQASSQSMPQTVTDNGTVVFNQTTNGTYAGSISGSGAVTKIGPGTTIFAAINSYSGGTFFNSGILQAASDASLGAPSGGLTFNGGTLQLGSSFDLAATRPITLNTGGGTIDTQGFTSMIAQGITGDGALTKAGAGTLTLAGDSTYTGGTTIAAGTLQLGNGGTTGSVIGNILDNGALAINHSNTFTLPGVISGTGSLAQNGPGTTILTGDNTYAGGTTIAAGTLQLGNGGTTGSVIGNITDNAALAFNRSDTITFPGVISGTGDVSQIGTGTTIFTASNTYSGSTNVMAGTLQAGAANTFSPNSAVNVASGGTLDLAGFDQTIPGLTNAGLVNMGTGTPPGTLLTVAGNYVGQGGTIALNTVLGGDGSASDRLVINGGTATGNSSLRITNAGGLGALTFGNGILVVDTTNGGTTAPGAFALSRPAAAGPYDYTLFRSSVDASNSQAWYLRSSLDCSLPANAAICSQPSLREGATGGPQVVPNFRPETSLYTAIPSMTLLYSASLLDTLHERVGDEEADLRNQQRLNGVANGAWGRVIGQHGNNDGDPLGVLGSGPKFDYDIGAFQGGQDLLRRDGADGSRDHAGLYGAVGLLTGNVTHFDQTFAGVDSVNAYSFGGYWTHFGAHGWYLDAILQATWYNVRGASTTLPALTTNGWGFASSLEGGYPIKLGGGFLIEPQVQIVYQNISLGDGNDTAATVQFRSVDSLAARLGARLARTWSLDDSAQRVITAWIRPSIWNEFRGDPRTLFSSETGPIPFQSNISGTWFELNAGVDAQITKATSLFASAGYQASTNGNATSYNGKAGLRVAW
jgi:outer membrane autotransporter protein